MGRGERPIAYTAGRACGVRKHQARAAATPTPGDFANARLIATAPTMAEFIGRVAAYFADTDAPLGIEARAILTQILGVPHA